ncbi:MAG: hypothetical protein ACFBWO_17195 [Paracoccaceae bacterium]
MRTFSIAACAALSLAACATDDEAVVSGIPPQPLGYPLAPDPSMTVELDRSTPEAIPFVEEIAARCWLDGLVQADAMIVDRSSGRIVMTGETTDLLILDFLPVDEEALASLRLAGPVLVDETKTETMLHHLAHATREDEIICPPLGSRPTPVVGVDG